MSEHEIITGPFFVKHERIAGFGGEGAPYSNEEWKPWESLLETAYDTPALALPYFVIDANGEVLDGMPRIKIDGVKFLEDQGLRVVMHSVWVDVDNPGHTKWSELSENPEAAFQQTLQKAAEGLGEHFETCYWYMTPSGYRLVWRLPDYVDVHYWRAWVIEFEKVLSHAKIKADLKAMSRWGQPYRLPRVTKGRTLLDLPRKGGEPGVLNWKPERTLDYQVFGTDESAEVVIPENIPPVDVSDWKSVKTCSFYKKLRQPAPLGLPGGRRNAIFSCAGELANLGVVDPALMYAMMAPAVLSDTTTHNSLGEPDAPPGLDVLKDAIQFAVGRQLAEMKENEEIRQALQERHAQIEKERHQALIEELEGDFFSDAEEDEGPTPLGHLFGKAFNVNKEAVIRAASVPLEERLFLLVGNSAYRYNENTARYEGPMLHKTATAGISRVMPTLHTNFFTQKGALMADRVIFNLYGTNVDRVVAVLGSDISLYDPGTQTLYQGVAQFASFKPVFHADVQLWLELLGGSNPDALFDWLATFPILSHPTAALYIDGAPGVGKGMLASGLARLFGRATPTSYKDASGAYNNAVEECPLVWADEYIPSEAYSGRASFSGNFRMMTGNSSITINEKFKNPRSVMGSLRVLITANNPNVIRFDEQLSPEDFAAVSKRILYLKADPRAAEYLRSLGGRRTTDSWVSSKVAEHVLWLMHNRPVIPGGRLLVEGKASQLHHSLQMKVGINELILEVIIHAIEHGQHAQGQILWGKGKVLVKDRLFQTLWERVHGDSAKVPTVSTVRAALRGVCDERQRVENTEGQKRRYFSVNVDALEAYAAASGAFEGETRLLLDKINRPDVPWVLKGKGDAL